MSAVYLKPRHPVGGLTVLEFPYTPQIEYSADVKYDTYSTTHTNYQMFGYTRSENPVISLNCKFSAHSADHFETSVNAIKFLRTYTKMNYGRTDPDRGQPPRILRFFAHGNTLFNDVPVVISKFNMTFSEDVDYVKGSIDDNGNLVKTDVVRSAQVPTNAIPNNTGPDASTTSNKGVIYLPIFFQISIGLLLQQNMYNAVNEFNLKDFAAGKLSSKGYI
jgi:hypothetical protein